MREPLDISFSPYISYSIYPSEELKKHGEVLLSMAELRERLQYYNKHICSLSFSYPQEGLRCYGKYDHGHSDGTLFFQKKKSGKDADFEIFLQERQKEIDRLKILIDGQDTYYGKLKCFMEGKAGQKQFDELKIESNEWETFIANGAGITPKHLENHKAEINLTPYNPDEIKSYNKYVREYVEKLMYSIEKRHWLAEEKYQGFLALPAMEVLRKQVERAFDKKASVKAELDRIEFKYKYYGFANYMEFLYPYSIDDLSIWQAALFNAFVRGGPYDYCKKKLKVHETKALIHVEQVFIYYKYVHLLGKNTVYSCFEELFKEIVENGILSELKNQKTLLINETIYRLLFNCWLQKRRNWEFGNLCDYQMYLTKKEFEEFLKEYKSEEQARIFLVGKTREESYMIFQKSSQLIRDSFRIKRRVTEEEGNQNPLVNRDDIITQDPPYSSNIEAFALLAGYYAPIYMELEKHLFVEKYKVWNEATIRAEISEIEIFIKSTQNQNLSEASRAFYKWDEDTDAFIYLRLNSGFYEHLEVESYPLISSYGNKEAHIYGRFFLFYNFLMAQLDAFSSTTPNAKIVDPIKDHIKDNDEPNADERKVRNTKSITINIQNNFDQVDIKEVYHHFKIGLVDKKYLAEEELLPYLKAAFEDKQAPKVRFKFINSPKKDKIMHVFYKYYTDVAGKLHGKQMLYAALLGDYFIGYNAKTVSSNFSKSGY